MRAVTLEFFYYYHLFQLPKNINIISYNISKNC